MHKSQNSLEEVIDRAIYNLSKKIGDKIITVQIPPDYPRINFEPMLLEQVFVQLLDNAAKYSHPDTPINIIVSKDKDNAIIEIKNHGDSLTPDEMKKVFDRFYRDSTNKIGMGLDLTICQTIIKAHGGLIWAENGENGGVIFCFTLPLNN